MNTTNSLTEWTPEDSFNILDFRDFKNFPQYENPPYVLKFRFSSIQAPLEIKGIVIDFMGWNIPECQTRTLFSKIQVSKNGFQDIYYNQPGGEIGRNHMTLQFEKNMVLRYPKDVLLISFFPLCPVHMVDIEKIVFLTSGGGTPSSPTTQPPDIIDNGGKNDNPIKVLTIDNQYWYIYATIFVMLLLLLLSLLFTTMSQSKKTNYIVIRTKK
jgi:hypothetical protein